MTQWWDRLPSAARWAIGLVYVLAIYVGVQVYLEQDHAGPGRFAIVLAVCLAIFVLGVVAQAHRLGGWKQWQMYRKAYSSGVVPEGARTERWLPIARRNARLFREGVWVQRVWLGVMTLAGVAMTILFVVFARGSNKWFALVFVAVLALAVWGTDKLWRWRRDQFARFLPALEDAAREQGTAHA